MHAHEWVHVPRDCWVEHFYNSQRWVGAVVQVGLVATLAVVLMVDASCVLALVLGVCVMMVDGE